MRGYGELLKDCVHPSIKENYDSLPALRNRFIEFDNLHPALFFATHGLYYLFSAAFVNDGFIELKEVQNYFDDAQNHSINFAFETTMEKSRENIGTLFNWGLDFVKNSIEYHKQILNSEIQRLIEYQKENSFRILKPEQRLYFLDFCIKNSPFIYSERLTEMRFITTNTAYINLPLGDSKLREDYIKENDISLVQAVELHTLKDLLYFELHHMILQDIPVLLCQYCKRYFVPTGRKDVKYCDRIAENETQPCSIIGATRVYSANIEANEVHAAFKRAYKRVNGRKRFGMTDSEFDTWSTEARDMRQRCLDGIISLDKFNDWLGNNDVKKGRSFK